MIFSFIQVSLMSPTWQGYRGFINNYIAFVMSIVKVNFKKSKNLEAFEKHRKTELQIITYKSYFY